jgi:hypothetical protein
MKQFRLQFQLFNPDPICLIPGKFFSEGGAIRVHGAPRIDWNLTGQSQKTNKFRIRVFNPDPNFLHRVKFFSEGGASRVPGAPHID